MKRLFLFVLSSAFCFSFCLASGEESNAASKLTFSGDIIFEWQYYHTKSRDRNLRGSGALVPKHSHGPIPTSEFTNEVDLFLDYEADPTYAKVQFQFENDCGIFADSYRHPRKNKNALFGSGELDAITLLKAYMGYHLMQEQSHTLDLEIGRRPLYDIFDSKIQFDNNFDGVLLSYGRNSDTWGDFNAKLASFVIDEQINQFGYVGELDFLAIRGSQLDIKYSLISWDHKGHNRYNKRHPIGTRFVNSQLLAVYGLPNFFGNDPSIYLAGLHNHAAIANRFTKHKKANNAFYGGVTLGQVKKKNDWSIDMNYQLVQAQAIPQDDIAGIGRDNPLDLSFYKYRWAGDANYKGYSLTYVYGLTDTLSLTLLYQDVHQASRAIGGKFHSSSFQISTTFTF